MQIPQFWRGRSKNDPAAARIAQFRAVIKAASNVPFYRKQMDATGLHAGDLDSLRDINKTLDLFQPLSWDGYTSLFSGRVPGWRQRPDQRQTRSALMIPYAEARAGLANCRVEPSCYVDLYSPLAIASATSDLYRLSKAVANPRSISTANLDEDSDRAMVVFSGMDAGAFTPEQRDELWNTHQVPVFEQFLGTDGRVIASECEVHNGLHIRLDGAIMETANGEVLLTSLTDLDAPAIRVRTGLRGPIEQDCCNCGRVEPRIHTVHSLQDTSHTRMAATA